MAVLEKDRRAGLDGEPRLFTQGEYRQLSEAGILGDGHELVHGVVLVKGTAKPWRWTCDDFDKMAEAGILAHEERVELIDGEVIALPPMGPEHIVAMARTNRVLTRLEAAFGSEFWVIPEATVSVLADYKPQPDIVIARGPLEEFEVRGVTASDVCLVVEVSNTSLASDRRRKFQLYAQAGIPEYWIINLRSRVLEVYRQPSESGYSVALTYKSGDVVEALFAPDVPINVSEFLPPL
jgi:Uma2 family endonuclease